MRPFLTSLMAASLLAAGFVAGAADAQVRTIPAHALTGKLTVLEHRTLRVEPAEPRLTKIFVKDDFVDHRISPGARIFDQLNRSIPSNMLPDASLASYVLDVQGQVRTVWVLTPLEVEQYKARPKK